MKEIRRLKITTMSRRIVRYQPPAVPARCLVCAREIETPIDATTPMVLAASEFTIDSPSATPSPLPSRPDLGDKPTSVTIRKLMKYLIIGVLILLTGWLVLGISTD